MAEGQLIAARGRSRLAALALGLIAGLAALAGDAAATGPDPPPPRRVLVLHDFARLAPAIVAYETGLTAALRARPDLPVNVYTEYLNLTQLDHGAAYPEETLAYLRAKYASARIELVAVTNSRLLRFALTHRDRLFRGIPLVFGGVDRHAASDVALPADVTGHWLAISWEGTLRAALGLQPATTRAVVVTGASAIDRVWTAAARAQLASFPRPLAIDYLSGLSLDDLLRRVAALPKGTVVLVGAFTRDAAGHDFFGGEAARRIAGAASVPVYTVVDAQLGTGVVGGHVVSFTAHGRRLGELALRVLGGERPPPGDGDTNVYEFDARQLRRWGLDARRLPPGSAVRFEEPSVWRLYGAYIGGGLLLIALQGALLTALLISRAKRRRVARELSDRLAFETLLSDLAALFAARTGADLDGQIDGALERVGAALGADRVMAGELALAGHEVVVTHAWTREGIVRLPAVLDAEAMPWTAARIREGKPVVLAQPDDLPLEATTDLATLTALGTRSLAVVPFPVSDTVTGYLSVASVREERRELHDLVARLTLLAEVFASALTRRRIERALEETRQRREELAHVQRATLVGELTGTLAHEINQPLAAIVMNTAAALRLLDGAPGAGEPETRELRETLPDIGDDAQRTVQIIKGIRALFRKEHLDHRPVDLNELIGRVIALLQNDLQRKAVRLAVALDGALAPVMGDPVQLQQVVLNLIANAGDAVLPGERREVTVATRQRPDGWSETTVADTGVGVPEADLERIFERFVSGKPGGLGMGLAISRSIVEQHGGRIWASRNTGHGLTLHVELPSDSCRAA